MASVICPGSPPVGSAEGHSGAACGASSVPGEPSSCTVHLKAHGSSSLEKAGKLGKNILGQNKNLFWGWMKKKDKTRQKIVLLSV